MLEGHKTAGPGSAWDVGAEGPLCFSSRVLSGVAFCAVVWDHEGWGGGLASLASTESSLPTAWEHPPQRRE